MNNEIANFFIEFTSKGLSELKSEMSDLKNSIDEMADSFNESSSSGDGFFGKLTTWASSLAGLAVGFVSVRKAITDMFNVADKTVDLHLTASRLGIDPLDIESLGRMTTRHGGEFDDAVRFYEALQELSFNLELGRFTQGQEDILSLTNQRVGYFKKLNTPTEKFNFLIDQLQTAFSNINDPEYKTKLQQEFANIPNSVRTMMETGKYWDLIERGVELSYMYTDKARKESIENVNARIELQEEWDKAIQTLTPAVTQLINEFITPLVNNFAKFAQKHDLGNSLVKWAEELKSWAINVWPDVKAVLIAFADTLFELMRWIFADGSWEDVKKAASQFKKPEKPITDEELEKMVAENNQKAAQAVVGLGAAAIGAFSFGLGPLGVLIAALAGYFGSGAGIDALQKSELDSLGEIPGDGPWLTPAGTTNNYANSMGVTINLDGKTIGRYMLAPNGAPMCDPMISATTGGPTKG